MCYILKPENEAVDYFQKFLQAESTQSTPISTENLQFLLHFRCSPQDNAQLVSPITPQKLRKLLSLSRMERFQGQMDIQMSSSLRLGQLLERSLL